MTVTLTHRVRIVLCALLLVPGILLLPVEEVNAGSSATKLVTSTPRPNQNLTAVPTMVALVFDQHLKFAGSNILVYDRQGQLASSDSAAVDKNDLTRITVTLKSTDHEVYLVVWHTVSADDNQSAIGAFVFGVNANAKDLSSASSVPVAKGSAVSDSRSPILAFVLGLSGLALGCFSGFMLGHRRRNALS